MSAQGLQDRRNFAWDPAIIVVDVLRHIGTNVSAAQFRDYLLELQTFRGRTVSTISAVAINVARARASSSRGIKRTANS